ncbi:hypothetical protein [Streptomyces tsukubensis]|uniref:hypothetical protein n=1 Tax=Streptomyces tsukubensis TaxID=83656 RepID=UPI00344CCF76
MAETGRAFLDLGDPAAAEQLLAGGLTALAPEAHRDRILYHVWIACARTRRGRFDAAHATIQVLNAVRAVESSRCTLLLTDLATELALHRASRPVRTGPSQDPTNTGAPGPGCGSRHSRGGMAGVVSRPPGRWRGVRPRCDVCRTASSFARSSRRYRPGSFRRACQGGFGRTLAVGDCRKCAGRTDRDGMSGRVGAVQVADAFGAYTADAEFYEVPCGELEDFLSPFAGGLLGAAGRMLVVLAYRDAVRYGGGPCGARCPGGSAVPSAGVL